MRILLSILICCCLAPNARAQETLAIYFDTLNVEQLSVDPPLYRVAMRVLNFTGVSALDYEVSLTSDAGMTVQDVTLKGDATDGFPSVGYADDGTGFRIALVAGEDGLNLMDGDTLACVTVAGDLATQSGVFACGFIEALSEGTDVEIIESECLPPVEVMFRPTRTLDGRVVTPAGEGVPRLTVVLSADGTELRRDTTADDGTYAFPEVPVQGSYSLSVAPLSPAPARADRIRGVNVGDLVLLARHIVETAELPAGLPRAAADVTGDGEISIADLLAIQRYIIARNDDYGDAPYFRYFAEVDGELTETVSFGTSLLENATVEFTVVKMGDVNLNGL